MLTSAQKKNLSESFVAPVLFDEPLSKHMAYQIGGPADALVFPNSEFELMNLRHFCKQENIAITFLGHGTNVLVDDAGIRGVSLLLGKQFESVEVLSKSNSAVIIEAGAGIEKQALLKWAIAAGFSGLEFSAGVPGTLGGGIFMNAGTKYGCYGDITESLKLFHWDKGIEVLEKSLFNFSYRHQNIVTPLTLVLEVSLRLGYGDKIQMTELTAQIISERTQKQPLHLPSCGSTFKNPEGYSAGRLVERAGFKGLRVGGAIVSEKHANFILNLGGATSADVKNIIQLIKEGVQKQFGVELECEVIFLGG